MWFTLSQFPYQSWVIVTEIDYGDLKFDSTLALLQCTSVMASQA